MQKKLLFDCHIFLVSILFLVWPHYASVVNFVRQPPRPIVFTPHNRPQSHPQQVGGIYANFSFLVHSMVGIFFLSKKLVTHRS
ncbi:hypothetical protein Hanom_Chr14g01260061 [Helianthus anomalus]